MKRLSLRLEEIPFFIMGQEPMQSSNGVQIT